jgi:hypothetical protein
MLALRSVDFEYHQIVDSTPSKMAIETMTAVTKTRPYVGTYESTRRFSVLDGRVRFEELKSQQWLERAQRDAQPQEPTSNITILSRERAECFSRYEGRGAFGSIANPTDLSPSSDWVVDVALGLRGEPHGTRFLEAEAVKQARVEPAPKADGDIVVTIPTGLNTFNSWYFRVTGEDATIVGYKYTGADKQAYEDIACEDFQRGEDGFLLPRKITKKKFYLGKDESYCSETVNITVLKYHDQKENTPERYTMVWPAGTRVTDLRTRENFVIGSTPRTLDDDFIAAASKDRLRAARERLNQIATQPTVTTEP